MKFEPIKPAPPVTKIFIARLPCSRRVQRSFTGLFIGAGFRDEIVGAQEGLECTRVGPPSIEGFVGQRAFPRYKNHSRQRSLARRGRRASGDKF